MEQQTILLNEAALDGAGAVFNAFGKRHVVLEVAMTGFTGTVKFAGSNKDTPPNFAAGASVSNAWDFVKGVNLIDGSAVNGGAGLTGTVTTAVYQVELNTNVMRWVCPIVSSRSAGTITVKAIGGSSTEY